MTDTGSVTFSQSNAFDEAMLGTAQPSFSGLENPPVFTLTTTDHLTGGNKLVILFVNHGDIMPTNKPPKTFVHIDTVTQAASGSVGILCIASLALSIVSKFDMINPFMAILMLVSSISFWGMTALARRRDTEV